MTALRISIASAQGTPGTPSAQDIGEQIRQSIQEATQQARDAAQQARGAAQQIREAQQQVNAAQQQVRAARTPAAKAEAQAALREAEAALREAQAALRGVSPVPIVYSTGQPPMDMQTMIPRQLVDISIGFFVMCAAIIIGWPLARAFGRRIERRGGSAIDPGMSSQLQRIEQAVEAVSIEVERISESQRFMAKLQSESAQRSSLPTAERR